MNEIIFREYLSSKGFPTEEVDQQVAIINKIEANLQKNVPSWTLEDLNPSSLQALFDDLIDSGENTLENFYAMLRYAKALDQTLLFNFVFEMLDGCEAMDNLHSKLAVIVGEELRDVIFSGLPLPPLGLSKHEKARYTYRIMRRMEQIFEGRICRDALSDSLRDLPDSYFTDHHSDFHEVSQGDIDRYLQLKGQKFIDTLRKHQQQGVSFFGQEITDEVINFVLKNPEIGGGVRDGNLIYETKIPYNTTAFLAETDADKKRYHYCHCQWVKESLRRNMLTVSPTFCQCSAGFHKKPYEVIFGKKIKAEVLQSVLKGDPICRFAIYLPEYDGQPSIS